MVDPLALYGAIVGTSAALGALWNIYSGIRDRARLRIGVSFSLMHSGTSSLDCVGVEVSNTGRRPTNIQSCAVRAADGRRLFYMHGAAQQYGGLGAFVDRSHQLPQRLNEGELHTIFWPLEALKQSVRDDPTLRLMWVEVTDAGGRKWRGRFPDNVLKSVQGGAKPE
jgi:hypothetical protein